MENIYCNKKGKMNIHLTDIVKRNFNYKNYS